MAEPRVTQVARHVEAGDEKGKCCLVGIGAFGLLAGAQVQPCELGALPATGGRSLLATGGRRHAEIEMAYDLEQALLALLRRRALQDQPADLIVQQRPLGRRDKREGWART